MPLILDNSFTSDSLGLRTRRFIMLSANIGDHSAALGLSQELIDWAGATKDAWVDALSDSNLQMGERDTAYETYRQLFEDAKDYYQMLKDLLLANIEDVADNREYAEQYGVMGRSPRSLGDFYAAVRKFKDANESLTAAGKPFVVPELFVTNLTTKTDNAANAWEMAKTEKRESVQAYDSQEDIFNEDNQKLRVVYQHGVLAWGKYNPLLEDLGFYPLVPKHGGQTPPAPQNLEYDTVMSRFSWLEAEGATSYQLAYRDSGSDNDWEEAYKGSDTSVVFNPGGGNWQFRVRARNEHGYGDWSNTITVEIVGGIPAPDWVNAVYSGVPPGAKVTAEQVEVTWANVAEATLYEVWRSVVEIDDPAGDFTMIGEIDNEMYLDFDLVKNKRNYYYIIAKNDTDRSEPSVTAYDDIVD